MSSKGSLLFPARSRYFPGQRWAKIALRTLHLIGVGGVGGGMLFALPQAQWLPCWWLTVLSGAAFVVLELWSNGRWLIQLTGLTILAKLGLLLCLPLYPHLAALVFVTIMVMSAVISHAPAGVRHYSPLLRRRLDDAPRSRRAS